jgi:hypothetical protein
MVLCLPETQSVQALAPVEEAKRPAEQFSQDIDPVLDANFPDWQAVQVVADAPE